MTPNEKTSSQKSEELNMEQLRQKYHSVEDQYSHILQAVKNECDHTVISNRPLYNVLLFENELRGYKVNGKEIANPARGNNECRRYSFDNQNRIIMVEDMAEQDFYFITMYIYEENTIETIRGDVGSLYEINLYRLGENGPIEEICVSDDYETKSQYQYEGTRLVEICSQTDRGTFQHENNFFFYYSPEGKLKKIVMAGARFSETVYSTEKINYPQLQRRLSMELNKAFSDFNLQHPEEAVSLLGIVCFPDEGYLSLAADVDACEYPLSPADWKYEEFASIKLVEGTLDSKEEQKVLQTIAKALVEWTASESFHRLRKYDGFHCTMFYHDEECIEQSNAKLKKILRDNPAFIG